MLFSMRWELLGSTLLTFTCTVQQRQSQLLCSKTFSFIRIWVGTFFLGACKKLPFSHTGSFQKWGCNEEMYVFMFVCLWVFVCLWMFVCVCVCMWVCVCVCEWLCACECVWVFLCMIICVCLSVYVCVHLSVCECVRMCVFLVDSELFNFKQFITTIYRTFLS